MSDAQHRAVVDELRRLSLPHHPRTDRPDLHSWLPTWLARDSLLIRRAAIAGNWPGGARL